jgi:hypothetical protein
MLPSQTVTDHLEVDYPRADKRNEQLARRYVHRRRRWLGDDTTARFLALRIGPSPKPYDRVIGTLDSHSTVAATVNARATQSLFARAMPSICHVCGVSVRTRSVRPRRPPPPPAAGVATESTRRSRRGSASAAAPRPHRFDGPIRTRTPTVRAHPNRYSYAENSLGPPTSCGSTGQDLLPDGNPRPLERGPSSHTRRRVAHPRACGRFSARGRSSGFACQSPASDCVSLGPAVPARLAERVLSASVEGIDPNHCEGCNARETRCSRAADTPVVTVANSECMGRQPKHAGAHGQAR